MHLMLFQACILELRILLQEIVGCLPFATLFGSHTRNSS